MELKERQSGVYYAAVSHLFFGAIIPLSYYFYDDLPLFKVLYWIALMGMPVIWLILLFQGKKDQLLAAFSAPKRILFSFIGAVGQMISMIAFIYGVTNGYGLAVSMAYFVLPLAYVLSALVIFREKISPLMQGSILMAVMAVIYLSMMQSEGLWVVPMIALSAVLFGIMRRIADLDPVVALVFDYSIFAVIAAVMLLISSDLTFFPQNAYEWRGYGIIALVNIVPLITLPLCIARLPFNWVGVLAWIAPSLTFLISLFYWKEPLSIHQLIAFVIIWIAMALYGKAIFQSQKDS